MNTIEAIYARRSVKHYDPKHVMTDDERRKLIEAAMQAPTAFNIQHWRFVVVDDPALRAEIRKSAWDQSQVTDASMLIVLCGDVSAWTKDPGRYWKTAPEGVREFMTKAIHGYYEGRPQVQRDEVMRSAGLVAQTIMLAAKDMGYDSCPMDGFDFDAVGKLIRLPADHAIGMMIAVGKSIKPAQPKGGQLPWEDIVVKNRF